MIGKRDDEPCRGLTQRLDGHHDRIGDSHLDFRDPVDGLQVVCNALRSALEAREDVGETLALVVRRLRRLERGKGPLQGHVARYTRGNDERNRDDLSAKLRKIPK